MDITSIRYINMDKNWHRKLFMELLLGAMSYPVIRKAGVKFRSDNPSYDKYLTLGIAPYVNSERSEGVVGCWIAHSQVLPWCSKMILSADRSFLKMHCEW
jgi:hypothetical protein